MKASVSSSQILSASQSQFTSNEKNEAFTEMSEVHKQVYNKIVQNLVVGILSVKSIQYKDYSNSLKSEFNTISSELRKISNEDINVFFNPAEFTKFTNNLGYSLTRILHKL